MALEKDKLIEGISKTGFILENQVRILFQKYGWSVINSRYYIDSDSGSEREMDLIAYKSCIDSDEKIYYYTAIIISCKKDVEHYWSFLTYKQHDNDMNFNSLPLHFITTDSRLKIILSANIEEIRNKIRHEGKVNSIFNSDRRVFAMQQVSKDKYKSKNDSSIYSSIITSIRATEAEKTNVNKKKGEYNVFYNFNLLSIVNADLCEVNLDTNPYEVVQINSINYINRHIINKKKDFYNVRFVNDSYLDHAIKEYNELHKLNKDIYPKLIELFYKDIFKYKERVDLFWDKFSNNIIALLNFELGRVFGNKYFVTSLTSSYDNENLVDFIVGLSQYDIEADIISHLNDPSKNKRYQTINIYLVKYYKYSGDFRFVNDLPF